MKFQANISASGSVRIEKWSEKRGTREVYEFSNVILDIGWDKFLRDQVLGGEPNLRFIWLGTGTNIPTKEDTGLQQVNAGTARHRTNSTDVLGHLNEAEGYLYSPNMFQFDWGEGEAEGTWTELGLGFWDGVGSNPAARGNNNTYTFPFSRALVRGEDGEPTSITVLSDEFLRIFYTLHGYFDLNAPLTMNINGVPVENVNFSVSSRFWEDVVSSRRMFNTQWLYPLSFLRSGQGNTYVPLVSSTERPDDYAIDVVRAEDPGAEYNFVDAASRAGNISLLRWSYDPVLKPTTHRVEIYATISVKPMLWDILHVGKFSSATATTGTQAGAAWTTNELAGKLVGIVGGADMGQIRTILSNTADTITIDGDSWGADDTSLYEIREYDYE